MSLKLVAGAALLLAVAVAVVVAASDVSPAEPKRNLRAAYKRIEDYLAERAQVNSRLRADECAQKSVDQLVPYVRELNQATPRDTHLVNSAASLVLLRKLQQQGKCDSDVADALNLIVEGTVGAEGDSGEPFPRIRAIVEPLLARIIEHCEASLESRLDQALEAVPGDARTLLDRFVDDAFLDTWRAEHYNVGSKLRLGAMNWRMDWPEWPANGAQLILGRLFELAKHDLRDRNNSYSVHRKHCSYNWPKINPKRLSKVLSKFLGKPCNAYLRQTEPNVLDLFYLAARYWATAAAERQQQPTGPAFAERFVAAHGDRFQKQLFVYEFCQVARRKQFHEKLWDSYRRSVYPNMIFGLRSFPTPAELGLEPANQAPEVEDVLKNDD